MAGLSLGSLIAYLQVNGASAAAAEIGRVQSSMNLAAGSAEKLGVAVEGSEAALTGAGRASNVAATGSAKFRAEQLSAIAANERYNAVLADGNASLGRTASAQAAVIRANARVAASEDAAAASARASAAAMTSSAESSVALSSKMGGLIATAGKLGLALGAFELIKKAIDITKEAGQFQAQMLQIQTVANASAGEVTHMTTALLSMAGQVATAPDQLAVSLYHVEQNGLRGAQALDVVKTAAEGAKIGMADVEQTTNSMTSAVASGISGVQNMDQAMGALLATVGTGDMKMSDLNEALGSGILSVAKTYGLSLKDVGASLAVFGDLNIRGADAASALRQTIMAFAKPAVTAKTLLDQMGMSTKTLAVDMQKGGLNQAVTDLRDHLTAAGITGDKVGQALLELFGKKAGVGVSILVDQFDRLQSKYAQLDAGAQSFADKWQKTTTTASFAFQKIGAEAQAAGIQLANKLLPPLTDAATWLGTNVPHDIALLQATLKPLEQEVGGALVVAWHALTAVLGTAANALGTIGHFLSENKGLVTDAGEVVLGMWAAWKGYQIVMAATDAIMKAVARVSVAASDGAASTVAYGRGVQATFAGNASAAEASAIAQKAAWLEVSAATTAELAQIDVANAATASAQAEVARAFQTASAQEIQAMEATAAIAQTTADESVAAAAEAATASKIAAGEVVAAGDTAAIGWSAMLGPLGLVAGGLAVLGLGFMHSGSSAKAAAQDVDSFTSSIKADSGALGENTRQVAFNSLQKSGAISAAKALGLSLTDVTNASLGNATAAATVGKAYDAYNAKVAASVALSDTGTTAQKYAAQAALAGGSALSTQGTAWNTLNTAIGSTSGSVKTAIQNSKDATAAGVKESTAIAAVGTAASETTKQLQYGVTATGQLQQSMVTAGTAIDDGTNAMKAQTTASVLLKGALDVLNGVATSVESTTDAFNISLGGLRDGSSLAKDSLGHLSTSLNQMTVAGATNRQTLVSLIQAAKDQAQATADSVAATKGQTAGLIAGNAQLGKNEAAILAAGRAAHLSVPEMEALIKSIGKLSTVKAAPKITVDTSQAQTSINALRNAIGQLEQYNGTNITIGAVGKGIQAHASGGTVGGAGNTDSELILATPGEEIINKAQSEKHRGLLKAINAGVDGFATGGTVGYTASNGTSYASQRAADNANASAVAAAIKALETVQREYQYTYLPNFLKALSGTTLGLENAGRSLIAEVAKTAQAHQLSASMVTFISDENAKMDKLAVERDSIAAKFKAANDKLTADLQAKAAEASSIASSLNNFNLASDTPATAAAGTADAGASQRAAAAAAQQAAAAATAAGKSSADVAAAAAAAAQAVIGAMSSGSSGDGGIGGVIGDLESATEKAALFGQEMQQLAAMGLNKTDLQQLADAGDTDAVMQRIQDLLAATPGQIAQINDLTKQLTTTASTVGNKLAGDLYDAGIAADKGIVAGLKAGEGEITKQITALADLIVATLKAKLQIHSPSKVMHSIGVFTGQGFADGLTASQGRTLLAARSLANASIPKFGSMPTRSGYQPLAGGSSTSDVAVLRAEFAELRSEIRASSRENAQMVTSGVGGSFDRSMTAAARTQRDEARRR